MGAGVSNTMGQQLNHSQRVKEAGVSHTTLCLARLILIPKTDKSIHPAFLALNLTE